MSLASRLAVAVTITLAATSVQAQQHQQHGAKPDSASKAAAMKHDMKGEHMMSPWKEMDAFHGVLGGTFHPAADKGDFAPLKANAQTLADKAKAWAGSTAPAACATPENAKAVTTIAASTADLAEKVKGSTSDADLKAAITAIHDTFETVEKSCTAKQSMKGMKH